MKRTYLCLTTLVVLGLVTANYAADKKEVKEINSSPEKVQQAKFINFSKQLNLSLSSLDGLGQRIDDARKSANPIDLALCAKLLEAAEAVAGPKNKTELASSALMTEAIELAKQRSKPSELLTLSKLVSGKNSKDLAALAQSVIDNQPEPGQINKDVEGDLTVRNLGHDHVDIYLNGSYYGIVNGHSWRRFHVHNITYLTAKDHEGHRWHSHVHYHTHDHIWTLNPPHHGHGH